MLKNIFFFIISFPISLFVMNGCSYDEDRLKVNVDHIKVDLKIDRMEKDLFENHKNPIDKHQYLIKKYDKLYQYFFAYIIGAGDPFSNNSFERLNEFTQDSTMNLFYLEMKKGFNDFSIYSKELTDAFKHYKYYFPDSTIPKVTTFYSNFEQKVLDIDDRLAIGIEMFLGKNNSLIQQLPNTYPQYVKDKMEKKYLTANVMYGFLMNRFYESMGNDFISNILTYGKVLYLLKAMIPESPEHIIMTYSKNELDWCKKNENNIWEYIVDQEILYSKNTKIINDFITEGPTTKGLPKDSPCRVGIWLGYQMIKDHVQKNNLDISNLLKEKNINTILKSYNPNE